MGQARQLAGLDQICFQKELAKRDIFIHYTAEDLEKDLQNLGISNTDFSDLLKKFRKQSDTALSLEEITDEVEAVRKARYVK